MNSVLNTPWGVAKIINGYYEITSSKEGYNGKKLHRLIWERVHGRKIPEGYEIHHKDNNKLNNCIHNLLLVTSSEHSGVYHNTTGFFRVSKCQSIKHSQGYYFAYQYKNNDNKLQRIISTDLDVLYSKVLDSGLPWKVVDKEKAEKTINNEINKEVVI